MKINEFSQPKQIDESVAGALFGDTPMAALKGLFTGKGTKQQMIQDIFLKDFYDDAYTSLDNAIKGQLVNTDLKDPLTGSTQVNPADIDPTDDPAPATSKTAGAVAGQKAQQQTTQTINNYVKGAAQAINQTTDKHQKIAFIKELVNSMAARQGAPEWENAFKGVEGIIKRAGADPNFASAAINNLKSGKTMAESHQIYFINKLIESVGLTWKDLGLCVITENKKYYIAETKFIKLNQLFESILEAGSGQRSVSQFMLDWFNQYMTGVDWKSSETTVLPLIQAIGDSYPSGYKNAIKTLAKTAFALSKSSPTTPKGMNDELSKMQSPASAPASNKNVTPEQVAADLASLRPREREEVINQVKKVS